MSSNCGGDVGVRNPDVVVVVNVGVGVDEDENEDEDEDGPIGEGVKNVVDDDKDAELTVTIAPPELLEEDDSEDISKNDEELVNILEKISEVIFIVDSIFELIE